jgi:transposase
MPRQILAKPWSRLAVLCGKAHFFVLDLPHSDACYVRVYLAAVAEAWMDGHVHAFAFFGAVPLSYQSAMSPTHCALVKPVRRLSISRA